MEYRPTRGEFAPPSLRQGSPSPPRRAHWPNEGRIRPSLIAASSWGGWRTSSGRPTRGEFAPPSLRPTGGRYGGRPVDANEGRIRPSLIAATRAGRVPITQGIPTRGEFAPPSLRHFGGGNRGSGQPVQRGANSPLPHCGVAKAGRAQGHAWPTRGEFAPPSLRHDNGQWLDGTLVTNEGRIRPSLIAAFVAFGGHAVSDRQRGANSPLPHCGTSSTTKTTQETPPTRGEFAPPSLRHRSAVLLGSALYRQRGANSPLPHCGIGRHAQLKPGDDANEGRIRPSLIAADTT